MPGVLAVITHEDVPDVRYGPFVKDRHLFARDVVRFEGEIVAAVAALTPEIAQPAADAIEVDFEPLPVVTDLEAALAADAPLVHEDWAVLRRPTPSCATATSPRSPRSEGRRRGGPGRGRRGRDDRYVADGVHAAPIEPRAIVAQWEGKKSPSGPRRRCRSTPAPAGETLQLPGQRVRIIVPHLGGGFGGKCGFHHEAHVAALARKARRPVRLVFSRREEFLVPDRRREGMVIDIKTGVSTTARSSPPRPHHHRQRRLHGRRGVLPAARRDARRGPVPDPERAHRRPPRLHEPPAVGLGARPTAPQACWALEQHIDEVAAASASTRSSSAGATCVDTGDVGPSGQVYGRSACRSASTTRAELAGYGQRRCPTTRRSASRSAGGRASPALGRVREAQRRRLRRDHHRRAGVRHGRGDGPAPARRRRAGHGAGGLPARLPGHRRRPVRHGRDRLADAAQQRPRGRRRRRSGRRAAAQARRRGARGGRRDIELADGHAHVAGSPDSRGLDRRAGGEGARRRAAARPRFRPAARRRRVAAPACVGDLGMAAFVAPQFSCHAVRIRLDRDTGVVRVLEVAARTTPARSSTRSAPRARSRAA